MNYDPDNPGFVNLPGGLGGRPRQRSVSHSSRPTEAMIQTAFGFEADMLPWLATLDDIRNLGLEPDQWLDTFLSIRSLPEAPGHA